MLRNTLQFVTMLHANNTREWFADHRPQYLEAKEEFEHFVQLLIAGIRSFDPEPGWITPRETLFRIYRDTRFSPDKTPYKNHFSAYLAKGGRKSPYAGYYLHIEPQGAGYLGGSLLSGGIYAPESAVLKQLREEIYYHYSEFLGLTGEPEFARNITWFETEMLKTTPRGFPRDFAGDAWLRRRDYCFFTSLPEELIESETLLDRALETFSRMTPLNHFLNRALVFGNE